MSAPHGFERFNDPAPATLEEKLELMAAIRAMSLEQRERRRRGIGVSSAKVPAAVGAPLVRAPRCLLRTDSYCTDVSTCLATSTCTARERVQRQLRGAQRTPANPLRSARR